MFNFYFGQNELRKMHFSISITFASNKLVMGHRKVPKHFFKKAVHGDGSAAHSMAGASSTHSMAGDGWMDG